MITRPLAVLLGGLSVLGLTAVHAATAYRRNAVTSHATFAETTVITPATLLLTTGNLFEWNHAIGIDEVSPDSIRATIGRGLHDLLNQCGDRGVALDWASFRSHVFEQPEFGVARVTIRVDVLS